MKKILALTDYKDNFGSKHLDQPYRSGMDKGKLEQYFNSYGFQVTFSKFSEIDWQSESLKDNIVIYTSSEDPKYFYKDFIEDIILALQLSNIQVVPSYQYLRANNNKVFMELLRNVELPNQFCQLKTIQLGVLEDVKSHAKNIKYPVVIKASRGALGSKIYLAKNENDLVKKIKKASKTFYIKDYLWDLGRSYKHKGYLKNSIYRKKFIIQEFIPDLEKDWKVLIFGDRYFILTRYNRKNDFRASGSKTNYKAGTQSEYTYQILDFAKQVFEYLDIPHVSLDIAFDGQQYYLLEMQGIYFGTSTINMSDAYFVFENNQWIPKEINIDLEKIYTDSIINFLSK
ncbi:ATP-grasp domain-containing protein [Aquimarina algicola]|uniref:ATP-grasp domain-containing protein n=1 Tax=Aquimarina algicola TaxID=2589995 RepID=A0A504JCE6_9FLAO|nr:hypothetical protein [Aquimarina algicola]TPN83991.1 hypothetical protein FHK87_18690 [Aquimarina algicola]